MSTDPPIAEGSYEWWRREVERLNRELDAYRAAAQSTDIEGDARDHFADLADWETPNGETPEWLVNAVMGFVAPHVCAASAAEHARDQAEAELARARAERDAMAALMERMPDTHARFSVVGSNDPPKCADWCDVCRRERLEAERDAARAAIQRFAADVARLIREYADEERGVIALMAFGATFDQLCLERYGIDLDKAAPERRA